MKHIGIAFVVGFVVCAAAGWGSTPVIADQGRPGNQGPWPVTLTNGAGSDGGFTPITTSPCSTLSQQVTDAGTVAVTVPTSPTGGRIWIQICNSTLNASTTQAICWADGKPTFSAGSAGDVLATGDCATYNITTQDGGVPWCITNAANASLLSTECVP